MAREADATALFATQQQGRCVFLCQSLATDAAEEAYYLGTEHHLHSTAFGRALLAHLPAEIVDDVLDRHGLPDAQSEADGDREALEATLAEVREQGFAYGCDGPGDEACSIAAPVVLDRGRETVGAIGIVGREEEIPNPGSHIKAQRFAESPATIVKRYAQILRNKVS
ncbi:IclR family transcriptional regulator C-terminal domain-containing protein [Halorubrum sp. CBA1125]|uniref:IclR family transcriptional regulator domain-containing protein n=1 Tax=Halorubrum sp. CBA1125 TaxID=2668072 RepID=UPI0012E8A6A1|nr:IclR family transcriptional regulator C-terminal domain-containing protein [Halorubrum sp. CBA1125]